jgi:hypothetical protein
MTTNELLHSTSPEYWEKGSLKTRILNSFRKTWESGLGTSHLLVAKPQSLVRGLQISTTVGLMFNFKGQLVKKHNST